jgi:hypothetical protein
MNRRTIVGVGMALIAAAAIPLGLPKATSAAPLTVIYNALNVKPLPIDQPGNLNPTGTNTATMCVQPLNGTHTVAVGTMVELSIDVGLFNTVNPGIGGSAEVTSTSVALTGTPAPFDTVASCTYQNQGMTSPVTLMDAIPITYTGPTTAQTTGRDVVAATSDGVSFDATTGLCVGPGFCNTGTYVFSPVTQYAITPSPTIAALGTLGAGAHVSVTVIAEDAAGDAVPGAYLDLSLTSTGASGGSATAFNQISGTTKNLNNLPNRYGADSTGSVVVAYTTANPLPSSGADTITAQNHPTATHENSTMYTYATSTAPPSNPYTAVTPFRACDTRPAGGGIAANQCDTNSTGAGSGPIGSGLTRVITIGGLGTVPSTGVTAIVVNVTAVAPTQATFLEVYPDGATAPGTSNLNPAAGQVVANLVEVGMTNGKIDVLNAIGSINVVIDIEGYVSAASTGRYTAASAPARICDTRAPGGGVPTTRCNTSGPSPIGSGATLTFNVNGGGSPVPGTGVTAVVFNLTGIAPSVPTVLTAFTGTPRPTASNLNLNPHQAVPNRVIVPVTCSGGNCTVSIWNGAGTINIAVDVDGWFSTTGQSFTALTAPVRLCNTQNGNSSVQGCTKGAVAGGSANVRNLVVTNVDGIPSTATAIVANVTAVNATTSTYVTVFPGPLGASVPNASDINTTSIFAVPNLVIVGVGSDASINLFNAVGSINLIVDVVGYYS